MNYAATIRYGEMMVTGRFFARFSGLRRGENCVIRTDRGIEVGAIVSPVDEENETDAQYAGEILRKLNEVDRQKLDEMEKLEEDEFQFCQKKIRERGLPMKLCAVEHLLGGGKIVFYFFSDGRVDFRALVKDLAQQYHTRIEMRQIGVRDEARLLAHYEHCGRELCCRTFIKQLEPVTMKMAKCQKPTLDPSKISGRCGRLMCCLRFEDSMYEELKRELPKKGTRVLTKEGEGHIMSAELLSQAVTVELKGGREMRFPLDEVELLGPACAGCNGAPCTNGNGEADANDSPAQTEKTSPGNNRNG